MAEARTWLFTMVEEYDLSPTYCGLSQFEMDKVEPEDHVKNMETFLLTYDIDEKSYAIFGEGRDGDEHGFALVQNGHYVGYGFIPNDDYINGLDQLDNYLIKQKETALVRSIVKTEIQNKNSRYKVIPLN